MAWLHEYFLSYRQSYVCYNARIFRPLIEPRSVEQIPLTEIVSLDTSFVTAKYTSNVWDLFYETASAPNTTYDEMIAASQLPQEALFTRDDISISSGAEKKTPAIKSTTDDFALDYNLSPGKLSLTAYNMSTRWIEAPKSYTEREKYLHDRVRGIGFGSLRF